MNQATAVTLYSSNNQTMASTIPVNFLELEPVVFTEIHVDTSNNVILAVEHTSKLGVQL